MAAYAAAAFLACSATAATAQMPERFLQLGGRGTYTMTGQLDPFTPDMPWVQQNEYIMERSGAIRRTPIRAYRARRNENDTPLDQVVPRASLSARAAWNERLRRDEMALRNMPAFLRDTDRDGVPDEDDANPRNPLRTRPGQ
jgi:hypothetical protein